MMESKRIVILKNSLEKKKKLFDGKIKQHFEDVSSAHGQPLNDKRNGHITLERWNKQDESLRRLQISIEKTEKALEFEKNKIAGIRSAQEVIPACVLELIKDGTLVQWNKHPTIFFVTGIDKARIGWNHKSKVLYHKYANKIQNKEDYKKFAKIFNNLQNDLFQEAK